MPVGQLLTTERAHDGVSMIGRHVAHYNIVEKVGAGGMGVVYRAEDTRLHRWVALKFLSPDLTRDEEAKHRFILEAQSASALEHPNICTIIDIGESTDGQSFMAMADDAGETLKTKIARGPLTLAEAVDYAAQVAEGLAKAHNAGIVHRDIKPTNIFITDDGIVKLLDFGIAKLLGHAGVTRTGTTLGTLAYMSPEQTTGSPADVRSDVWFAGRRAVRNDCRAPPVQRRASAGGGAGDCTSDSGPAHCAAPLRFAGTGAHRQSRARQNACRSVSNGG